MTPSILDAKVRGHEAGQLCLAPSLNPFPDNSIEATTWESERILVIARKTIATLERLKSQGSAA